MSSNSYCLSMRITGKTLIILTWIFLVFNIVRGFSNLRLKVVVLKKHFWLCLDLFEFCLSMFGKLDDVTLSESLPRSVMMTSLSRWFFALKLLLSDEIFELPKSFRFDWKESQLFRLSRLPNSNKCDKFVTLIHCF